MTETSADDELRIGDEVLASDATPWIVLNRPDGSGMCDGLFQSDDGRQMYGEHLARPLIHLPVEVPRG